MEFLSILYLQMKEEHGGFPAFYQDLNLELILECISRGWGEDVSELYRGLPPDEACEQYRREVYRDVKQEGVYDALLAFLDRMKTVREATVKKENVDARIQKAVWNICEAGEYCAALRRLSEALAALPLRSGGFLALRGFLQDELADAAFVAFEKDALRLHEELKGFHLTLTYENDRVTLEQRKVEGAYAAFLNRCFPGVERTLNSPFSASLELSELELELMELFEKQNPGFFRETKQFYKKYRECVKPVFVRLASELRYYLAFYRFEKKMRERGCAFAEPGRDNAGAFCASGLYDLALSCARQKTGEEGTVVPNDFHLGEGECMYVLTGPNQGGKTTFARSLGQLVFFTRMGLDVPAVSANVPFFTRLMTHFSVEESVKTGRGKLKEELDRLAPMMTEDCRNAFVILNELFTTAANYDAEIMGKRVIDHFLALDCRGIYVTHLPKLAEPCPGVVSLVATVDEEGRRTFRIERGSPVSSADAVAQVQKHGLTYGQLKERLCNYGRR